MMLAPPSSGTIPYLRLLSPQDQLRFHGLRRQVGGPESRYNRNQRIPLLHASLAAIRSFCVQNDSNDWARSLVCGILWLTPEEIAVNARQLKLLFRKSKSTINGAFSLMGYVNVTLLPEQGTRIARAIPYLATHAMELRQWTIRRLMLRTEKSGGPEPEEIQPSEGNVRWLEDLISDDGEIGSETNARDEQQWGFDLRWETDK
jgi:hypothetical protein